jgi:hypothetical protein
VAGVKFFEYAALSKVFKEAKKFASAPGAWHCSQSDVEEVIAFAEPMKTYDGCEAAVLLSIFIV